ncbi:hypothetical protein DL89DRAFT_321382 [Linderina pennispora]|uniref:PCI domain-containing protein n=1 Tax=Linderina pennispora TaxID=61395 RepID=A0A1Y1WFP6_9FUNG|nr:uncharacterized protein DL89DRAFT_321382 [Linderina pennispora]ORX72329.1 hypothetical protein DL89DRAFT_321382 [Linderina pennispora]
MDAYLGLLKNATNESAARIILDALENDSLFHFTRLLEAPPIAKLAESDEFKPYLRLLEIFSFGTLSDYKLLSQQLPEINGHQLEKLKYLTLVTLASHAKVLQYNDLMSELECTDEQQMEDLVIESIYNGLLSAKLDQQRRLVEVDFVVGRDASRADLREMLSVLNSWSAVCDTALSDLNSRISNVSSEAVAKQMAEKDFTERLQEVRVKYAPVAGDGDEPLHSSQYTSTEYQREEQRKATTS